MLKLLNKKWQRIQQVASTQETQDAAQTYQFCHKYKKFGKGTEVLNLKLINNKKSF